MPPPTKVHLIPKGTRAPMCSAAIRKGAKFECTRVEFNRKPRFMRCSRCDVIINGKMVA